MCLFVVNCFLWSEVKWSKVQKSKEKCSWREMKWSEEKWSEVEVKWRKVKKSEKKWSEVKWREMKKSEVELRWSEVKLKWSWTEMKLKMKWSESHDSLFFSYFFTGNGFTFFRRRFSIHIMVFLNIQPSKKIVSFPNTHLWSWSNHSFLVQRYLHSTNQPKLGTM